MYRLLLWVDRTIGLAHCYESDKCQPGKPWYARALAFHDWLSDQLGVAPADVGVHIDWLFRTAADELARSRWQARGPDVEAQRVPYAGRGCRNRGKTRS